MKSIEAALCGLVNIAGRLVCAAEKATEPTLKVLILSMGAFLPVSAAQWPGLPPDCWKESRIYHAEPPNWIDVETPKLSQVPLSLSTNKEKPKRSYATNNAYYFIYNVTYEAVDVKVYAEKEHLLRIKATQHRGLNPIKWINEKLLFLRIWYGRFQAMDYIVDVEREKIIYTEAVYSGMRVFQQWHTECPYHGCKCIKKSKERPTTVWDQIEEMVEQEEKANDGP